MWSIDFISYCVLISDLFIMEINQIIDEYLKYNFSMLF